MPLIALELLRYSQGTAVGTEDSIKGTPF